MKSTVALTGTVVSGILFYSSWQLCADSNSNWPWFLAAGCLAFFLSAAVACAPSRSPNTTDNDI